MVKKGKYGFTLIELLAAIIIMGIIMTIVTPLIISYAKKVSARIDDVTQKIIFSASDSYLEKRNNIYPFLDGDVYCISIQELLINKELVKGMIDVNTGDVINPLKVVEIKVKNRANLSYKIVNPRQCIQVIKGKKTEESPDILRTPKEFLKQNPEFKEIVKMWFDLQDYSTIINRYYQEEGYEFEQVLGLIDIVSDEIMLRPHYDFSGYLGSKLNAPETRYHQGFRLLTPCLFDKIGQNGDRAGLRTYRGGAYLFFEDESLVEDIFGYYIVGMDQPHHGLHWDDQEQPIETLNWGRQQGGILLKETKLVPTGEIIQKKAVVTFPRNIAELIFIKRELKRTEEEKIETYFNEKYNLKPIYD